VFSKRGVLAAVDETGHCACAGAGALGRSRQ
jgi:hypothetical protein